MAGFSSAAVVPPRRGKSAVHVTLLRSALLVGFDIHEATPRPGLALHLCASLPSTLSRLTITSIYNMCSFIYYITTSTSSSCVVLYSSLSSRTAGSQRSSQLG